MANSIASKGAILAAAKAVTTAGTAVPLLEATDKFLWPWIKIKADKDNTNQIYVGGSGVDSSTNGGLDATDELVFFSRYGFDLTDIYIDSDTNGEGVDFWCWVS